MITAALIFFASYILIFISALLPQSTGIPVDVQNAVLTFGGHLRVIDVLLPVDALAVALTTVISLQLAIFAFKSFKWLLSHLPFVGGHG